MMPPDQKMRIAHVAPLWAKIPPTTYGGIELAVNLLVEELVARGHDVTLFASADCVTSARLHAVCEENLIAMMGDGRAYTGEFYINAGVSEALQRAGDFDVLHFHNSGQWIPFGAVVKTPSVFTLHSALIPDDYWVMARYPQVAKVGISQLQVRGIEPKPTVIYNGCNFDAYEPRYDLAPGKYLAFLGRMSSYKNPVGAIEIARKAKMPLVMAGMPQDHIEQAYFNENVVPLIDGDRVRHIGPVNHAQKNEFLRNAGALLFPVDWEEPFGLVMIEAMACGTPVLATPRGAVAEVVDPGVTGFISADLDELVARLPDALALDRRAVCSHARSRFHFTAMVDQYEQLYRELAAGR